MTVADLIEALQKCDPDRRVVIPQPGMGGPAQATTVVQMDIGGLGLRYSFQITKVVHICRATPGHLQDQGYDVKGEFPCHSDQGFDYEEEY